MRASLGIVWGSFGIAKGLISRMLLGGLKVDFESAWVGSGLICATCAACCSGFRVALEMLLREFGVRFGGWGQRLTTDPKPSPKLSQQYPERTCLYVFC